MTFSGKIFFPSKVPEFLHVFFNLVENSLLYFFLTEMLSVFGFVAFIVHASIFCLRFSQKQSANQPKKIQGNGLLLINIKAHAKIQALLKEKNFTRKSHLRPSCTKPFNFRQPAATFESRNLKCLLAIAPNVVETYIHG